jgi:hypothetical protein
LIVDVLGDNELDPDLKRYIIARLRDVERALADTSITGVVDVELAVNSMMGAVQREPDTWDRIAKTKWAPQIGAAWMAIVTTLGGIGAVPGLLPGGEAPPTEVNQTVIITDGSPGQRDGEVVDAEIVEDDGPPSEHGR